MTLTTWSGVLPVMLLYFVHLKATFNVFNECLGGFFKKGRNVRVLHQATVHITIDTLSYNKLFTNYTI